MKKQAIRPIRSLIPWVVTFLLVVSSHSQSQDSLVVHLNVSDARGHMQTMRFGVDERATLGFDRALGEMALPPYPPVPVFDVRFLHPDPRSLYAGDGSYADIRPLVAGGQVDTFIIRMQAAEDAYPIRISWDSTTVAGCDSVFGFDRSRSFGVFVDLKRSQMYSITHSDLSTLVIVMRGPHGGTKKQGSERRMNK